jgi:diguanylate cyclase (GGDEF)-like protein/PAS domain S-box-containing protein
MEKHKEAIRLLVSAESQNEAEGMVSLLRTAGHATRAHWVNSMQELTDKLNAQSWDLCLARLETPNLSGKEVLSQIQRLGKDVPTILLHTEVDSVRIEQALKMGAQDIVPTGENNHLIQIILRELKHLRMRRELREAEAQFRESEKRCQTLLESSKDAIAYVHEGMHIFLNESYAELFGYEDPDDILPVPVIDLIAAEDQGKYKIFEKDFRAGKSRRGEMDCTITQRGGESSKVHMRLQRATYDEESCTQIVISSNQDSAAIEAKLTEVARQDILTGLNNRHFFMECLSDAIDNSAMSGGSGGALLYVNIDHFGKVRSLVGIEGADLVVSDIAHLIKDKCRKDDIIGRISDDVFGIISPDSSADHNQSFAELIRKAVADHLVAVKNRTIQVTVSIGVAIIGDNTRDHKVVLEHSHEAADYVRKEHKDGNGVYIYNPAVLAESNDERLKAKLVNALKSNQFRLLFQPLMTLRDDPGEHYEVLLRLIDEDKEVSPIEFMNDSINPEIKQKIDRWVILNACKMLSEKRAKGSDARLFINMTPHSLSDIELVKWVAKILQTAKLPPHSLIFQFSEVDVISHLKQAAAMTSSMSKLGCKLAISRFGCAVKPFELFEHVNADYVKVDGSFTQELNPNNPESVESLKELLEGIHEKQKKSIVPLVEHATTMAPLWTVGVHFIQGYYLQAPNASMDYNFAEDDEDEGETISL